MVTAGQVQNLKRHSLSGSCKCQSFTCSNLKAGASLNCVPNLVLALLAAPQFPRGGLIGFISKNKSEVKGENRTPLGTK